jgi:hypothetical protein
MLGNICAPILTNIEVFKYWSYYNVYDKNCFYVSEEYVAYIFRVEKFNSDRWWSDLEGKFVDYIRRLQEFYPFHFS